MEKKIFNYSNIYLMVVYCKFNLDSTKEFRKRGQSIHKRVFKESQVLLRSLDRPYCIARFT